MNWVVCYANIYYTWLNVFHINAQSEGLRCFVAAETALLQPMQHQQMRNAGQAGQQSIEWAASKGPPLTIQTPGPPSSLRYCGRCRLQNIRKYCTVLNLSGGWGFNPPPPVPLNPQVCIDPRKIVNISQKYIADPPPSGFPTNRLLILHE